MEPGQTGNRASGGITPAAGTPGQPTPEGQAEAQALTAAGGGRLDVLLEAARPDLYRLNGFRIAELPVDAGARDVSRRQQMVEMARETGLPIPPGPGRALPMNNASDPDVLAQAVQRLRDPERRLVDEFFWFWPHVLGQSKSDTALTALAGAIRPPPAASGRSRSGPTPKPTSRCTT